jgi:hypothetical protein
VDLAYPVADSASAWRLCRELSEHGMAEVRYVQSLLCLSQWQKDSVIVLRGSENCTIVYFPDEPCLECSGRTW